MREKDMLPTSALIRSTMKLPYEEWRKTDLIERVYDTIPAVIERFRKNVPRVELSVEQVKLYIKAVSILYSES